VSDLVWAPATELARAYRTREASRVEVVDAVLARLDTVNPSVNEFATVSVEEAREQAKTAHEQLRPEGAVPPQCGIPATVKDLTAGARLLGVAKTHLTNTTGTPWDPQRTADDSSRGAAAAVAAGMGQLALASDGGGSMRVPVSPEASRPAAGATGAKR
jgi:Asp-tRNA(Asn)/Glu-tRNA(Gln) amidotransferase A subunit family amidase